MYYVKLILNCEDHIFSGKSICTALAVTMLSLYVSSTSSSETADPLS